MGGVAQVDEETFAVLRPSLLLSSSQSGRSSARPRSDASRPPQPAGHWPGYPPRSHPPRFALARAPKCSVHWRRSHGALQVVRSCWDLRSRSVSPEKQTDGVPVSVDCDARDWPWSATQRTGVFVAARELALKVVWRLRQRSAGRRAVAWARTPPLRKMVQSC